MLNCDFEKLQLLLVCDVSLLILLFGLRISAELHL